MIQGCKRDMKSFFQQTVLLLGTVFLLVSCTKTYTPEEIDKLFEPITSRYGIKIVYEIGEEFGPILIGGWRTQFDKAEPIDHRVLARYPRLLQKAFEKYPDKVIKTYLNAIYFAKKLDIEGFQYGGTYDPFRRIVYLVNDGKQPDDHSVETFHHEFSSMLLARHGFFLNPWFGQNPKGFKYRRETYEDRNKEVEGTSLKGTDADYEKGFMNTYAQTTFENDFNEYARMIFTHPKKFKKIMAQYPRVRGKFLVWLEFYRKIDPIFTEAYLLGED